MRKTMFNYIDEILESPVIVPNQIIGYSRENRPIHAAVLGKGKRKISLIGGCHADEPVGPRLLRKLYAFLSSKDNNHPLVTDYLWHLVPHANPDGEAINKKWYGDDELVFDLISYMRSVVRELPGDDIEFGFPRDPGEPGLRSENEAIHDFWISSGGPFHLHASLHGMMVAAGPWFLIEKSWIKCSSRIQSLCRDEVARMNYRLHDVDRKGEKGFHRISRGFCTRPDSNSMRAYFLQRGNREMAEKFFPSSMEAVRDLGGDPLTIVSEMPLFILPDLPDTMSWPDAAWDRWNEKLQQWKTRLLDDPFCEEQIRTEISESGIEPMPVNDQMRFQWRFLSAAIEQLEHSGG